MEKPFKSKGSFGRKSKQDSEHHSDHVNRNSYESETGSVSFVSKDDAMMTSPKVRAAEDFELVSTEGKTSLKADQSSESHRESSSGSSLVWQSSQDKGSSDTTVEVADVKAESYNVQGALGTEIDLKANGNLEQTLAALAQDPETAWLAELAKDPAVQVQLLKEYHKHWNHKQSGLTAGGAVIIALAVAIATAGAGSAVSAGVAGAAGSAGASTAVAGLMGAMSKAAFMSLVSSASVSLVNNKGDFGKVFAELASKQQMRSLAVAVATAGLTHGVGGALDIPASTDGLAARVQNVAVQRGAQTIAETVIYGDDFGDAVKRNVLAGVVDFGAGLAAQMIGEMYHGDAHDMANSLDKAAESGSDNPLQGEFELNYVTHKLAHAVLGATVAGVTGEDIVTGAIAAPLGEILTEEFGKHYQKVFEQELEKGGMSPDEVQARITEIKENSVQYAKLGAGLVALSTGRDVNTAANIAGNSAENNILPLIGAGLVLTYEVYNVFDTAHEAYKALDAFQKDDTEAAIESSILVGMAVIPGEKFIPAPMRKAAAGFVKNQATKMLRSKIGQTAVKAGGAVVDAASSKVQNLTARVTDSSLVKGAGKKLEDWGVSKGGKAATQQAEKGVDLSPRVKQNYWNDVDHFTAHGQTNKVYKRDDLIDLNRMDKGGRTNIQRMEMGLSPIGPDGKTMNLHHMLQTHDGPIAEVTDTFHKKYSKIIHINPNTTPSGINRNSFNKWREDYWADRVDDLMKK